MEGLALPILQPIVVESKEHSANVDCGEFDLRNIILRFEELPVAVRQARFTRVEGRVLDQEVMKVLTSQSRPPNCNGDWALRLQKRRESLLLNLGKLIYCIFIRVPGAHYTVEIDPEAKTVIHWEWQEC
jgi:hypothetical protein